ncbi:MAG: beta-galactosidase, partial [Clostridia bacterium]|nr:beta-galactosidase [Clostridia bacterium]
MIYGVDYYPEHWDRAEWENQAKLMQEGGFNTVRMGEFAWKLFEPKEGEFDFSFLDDAIEILAKYGVKTILGTPTAAPPKWLNNKYDIVMRDKYGRRREWGARRECCANNPDYI